MSILIYAWGHAISLLHLFKRIAHSYTNAKFKIINLWPLRPTCKEAKRNLSETRLEIYLGVLHYEIKLEIKPISFR